MENAKHINLGGSNEQSNEINEHWYKMKNFLIRTQLQYCAILSQVGNHHQALKIAIEVS